MTQVLLKRQPFLGASININCFIEGPLELTPEMHDCGALSRRFALSVGYGNSKHPD